jgi:hypothetical protein
VSPPPECAGAVARKRTSVAKLCPALLCRKRCGALNGLLDHANLYCRALARLRDALAHRAYEVRTFSHTQKAEMLGRIDALRIKAGTGVLNPQPQLCPVRLKLDADGNVSCVLLDISETSSQIR